jgi:hypothetical protein
MWLQKGKTRSLLNAGAFMGGSAKSIQPNLGGMADAAPPELFAKIRSAIKTRILFLYWDSPVEESRQLEKPNYRVGLVRSPRATVKLSSS